MGASSNSVIPEIKIIANEAKANQMVIRLNEQANSIKEKAIVRISQNQGDNTNL
jgi:hypothetical protein